MNIILIGCKYTGKTTTGKSLAKQLGYHFLDTDRMSEFLFTQSYGVVKSMREIFYEYGETIAYNIEKKAVALLPQMVNTIVATGGGTILCRSNRSLLQALGTVIHLVTDVEMICQRMQQDKKPFFIKQSDPIDHMRCLYQQRKPIYDSMADFNMATQSDNPESIASKICQVLDLDHV